jgi:MFS family permease
MAADPMSIVRSATLLPGFCLFTSATALYVVIPAAFPASVRSTGTGFSMGMGRVGAISAPLVAGLLVGNGWSRAAYCIALAVPALVAAVGLFWIGVFDAIQRPSVDNAWLEQSVKVQASPGN